MKQYHKAFTLVEVLLTLTISGVIGAMVLMMLATMGNATQKQHDIRRVSVTRQVACGRLASVIRNSCRVLAWDTDYVVLWKSDFNRNAKPELSELNRIEWDGSDDVWVYVTPDNLSEAADTTFEVTDNFDAVTTVLAGSVNFPGELLLRGVRGFGVTAVGPDALSPDAVQLEVSMQINSVADTYVIVAALRVTDQ